MISPTKIMRKRVFAHAQAKMDTIPAAKEISKECRKIDKIMDVLVEVNVGMENSKFGIDSVLLTEFLSEIGEIPNIRVKGLMAIPPISQVPGANTGYFADMNQLFIDIRDKMSDNQNKIDCLSMGMSGDFEDAIAQGATLVRVGTSLFGPRPPMVQTH